MRHASAKYLCPADHPAMRIDARHEAMGIDTLKPHFDAVILAFQHGEAFLEVE
jgi:hypothetical protein